jgi:DNA repair protein RadC
MDDAISNMEILLARYAAQQDSVELGKKLLQAVDEILDAKPNELQARVEGLRVVRRAMRGIEQAANNIIARAKKPA